MKALSIREPWCWAILEGHKDIENRSRRTHHRGPLLLHASKTFERDSFKKVQRYAREDGFNAPSEDVFEPGGIVGVVDLVDCVEDHASTWFNGPYGYVLSNPRRLPFVPLKGQVGVFTVPDRFVPGLGQR